MSIQSILVAVDFGNASARGVAAAAVDLASWERTDAMVPSVGGLARLRRACFVTRRHRCWSSARPRRTAHPAPEPRTAEWTSNYGQPLVQWCTVPILFVPEPSKGDSL